MKKTQTRDVAEIVKVVQKQVKSSGTHWGPPNLHSNHDYGSFLKAARKRGRADATARAVKGFGGAGGCWFIVKALALNRTSMFSCLLRF